MLGGMGAGAKGIKGSGVFVLCYGAGIVFHGRPRGRSVDCRTNQEGDESKQIDVIVTSDVCPQFNFHNPDGQGKSFACVDGTLAVASLKSFLDSKELRNALDNIASIPQHRCALQCERPGVEIANYNEWPYKIVYAPRGVSEETLTKALSEYYVAHPAIPKNRWPDLIHVAGGYCVRRSPLDIRYQDHTIPTGTFYTTTVESDVAALAIVVEQIQQTLVASRYIPYYFGEAVYKMFDVKEGES